MRIGRIPTIGSCGALLALAMGVAALWTTPASAQEWLRDRRNSQGPGLMLSDSLVLHLGAALEGGYDSNVFYAASDATTRASAGRIRVTPQVELATLPPQRTENPDGTTSIASQTADFFVNVAAMYNQYISTDEATRDAVMDQSDVGIQSSLGLTVHPRRVWSFVLRNMFARTLDPANEAGPGNYNRDYDMANLGVRWAPGGGAFELNLLAGFAINMFERGGTVGNVGNYLSPSGSVSGRWKFYPNTALTFESNFSFIDRYDASGGTATGDFMISNSYPIRTWLGLNGQWSPVIATALRVGYGAGFYDKGDDFDSVLAQAEIEFILTPTARIKVGFLRDFVDSYFSNYYVRNQGYVRWDQMFGGSFLVAVQANVRYLEYATLYNADGTQSTEGSQNPRSDIRLDGSVFAEYRVKDWLGFNATVNFENNITDFRWGVVAPDGSRDEAYWKLTAFLGARFIY